MKKRKRNSLTPIVLGMVSTLALSITLLSNANAVKPDKTDEPVSSAAVVITPTSGTATIDGDAGEWNTGEGSADFAATMCTAGSVNHDTMECEGSGKENLSDLFLRYDCDKDILYVLVLKEEGKNVKLSKDDAWFKIDGTKQLTNFTWVESTNGELLGYEGSFDLAPGPYPDVEAHLQFLPDDTSSTGKDKTGKISIEVPATCNMPQVEPHQGACVVSFENHSDSCYQRIFQGKDACEGIIGTSIFTVPDKEVTDAVWYDNQNCAELGVKLLATDVELTATLNGNGGVDLTLTTSAEPNTAALLILRGDKLGNGGTEINTVCGFASGDFQYTCTDDTMADTYRAAEVEYDGSLIIYDEVTPK